MFNIQPKKSTGEKIGDFVVAVVALPIMAVVWIADKVIGVFSDNI